MPEPVISVIIPTRDRRELLEKTLRGFAAQSLDPEKWEIIVVDDASVDGAPDFLKSTLPLQIRSIRASGNGPATARNLGISAARGERILLMGDDMIPARDLLETHLRASAARDLGIQGRIEWDPDSEITDLMRFMAPEGPQFYFRGLKDGDRMPFSRIYGANFSAPRRFFLEEPFDQHFHFACMEDTEMAWRWKKRGWTFLYSEQSKCVHNHRYDDLEDFLARQRRAGREARYCIRRHPGLFPTLFLFPALHLLRLLLRTPRGLKLEQRWDIQGRLAYLAGRPGL